jgi:tight adherence protein B
MRAFVPAIVAAYGVHLVWTALAFGWTGLRAGPAAVTRRTRPSVSGWLAQAGLDDVDPKEYVGASCILGALAAVATYGIFGGPMPALAAGLVALTLPTLAYRERRRQRFELAQECWPRLIGEIRVLISSVGRSIPQALFDASRRAPAELQPPFEAARREWLLTTDFGRTVAVLKARLADPTADAACETLLVAHEVGGADIDRRLEALAEDRWTDLQSRRDARAEQAGVRFARRFVLIVPLGMALAGMSVGNGRAAYGTPTGQLAVVVGLVMVGGCWIWAGRILRLPAEHRVFDA